MYGQNLGGRPDAPGEPIITKFCMRVRVRMCFLVLSFRKIGLNVGAVGVEISPLPLKRHFAYTTACCYRTGRDELECHRTGFDSIISSLQEYFYLFTVSGRGAAGSRGSIDPPLFEVPGPPMQFETHF